jgi:hypothetical protein
VTRRCFELRLEPVVGSRIEDTIASASTLALALPGVSYITYRFNESDLTVYPDGGALEVSSHKLVATWEVVNGAHVRKEFGA